MIPSRALKSLLSFTMGGTLIISPSIVLASSVWYPTRSKLTSVTVHGYAKVIQTNYISAEDGWKIVYLAAAAGSQAIEIDRTLNGGKGWQRVYITPRIDDTSPHPNGIPFANDKSGISFVSPTTGWVTGWTAAASDGPYLYVTHDGGYKWTPQKLQVPRGIFPAVVFPPIFFSRNLGFIPAIFDGVKKNPPPTVYATQNGGKTWKFERLPKGELQGVAWSFNPIADMSALKFTFAYKGRTWQSINGVTWSISH